jgi:hypothetical protein
VIRPVLRFRKNHVMTGCRAGGRITTSWSKGTGGNLLGGGAAARGSAGNLPVVDDSPEIYENMAKALAILTAWNESGDGDVSLAEQTTMAYLDGHPQPEAKIREAINLISGLTSLSGRMLLQLAQTMKLSEAELLRIMGQSIVYRI